MIIKTVLSLILVSCISTSIASETVDVLSMDYPPFTAEADGENGPLFRLLRDYAREHMPTKRIRPVFVPPARASLLLSKGEYCLSFYPPPEHQEEFEFIKLSDETVKLGFIRARQAGAFVWKDLSELKGKSSAILRPSRSGRVHEMAVDAGMEVVYVDSIRQGLMMLKKGRVDYAFGDNNTLARLSESAGMNKDDYQFSETSLFETTVGITVRKSCKEDLFAPAEL